MYKSYKFGIHNWKSGNKGFWFYKRFPSAYMADRWATKISFEKKDSNYMIWLCPGEEKEA